MLAAENAPQSDRPKMLTDEQVARITHRANMEYRAFLGQPATPAFDDLPEYRRAGIVDAVNGYRTGRIHSPESAHEAWVRTMADKGYTLGDTIDDDLKTHPNMRPYEELPIEERRKDAMFVGIIKALSYGSVDKWPTF